MTPEEIHALAQDQAAAQNAMMGGFVGMMIYLALVVLMIAALWKVFVKAGKPGWAAIIPIYNLVVLLEIAGKPLWQILLFCIPLVNFVMILLVDIEIAKRFGKSAGFGIGLLFLPFVFFPMLAFTDAQYQAA